MDLQPEPILDHPPFDDDAERRLLGCVLVSASKDGHVDLANAIYACSQPGLFYREAHTEIAEAMVRVFARGESPDIGTLELEIGPLLGDARTRDYLALCREYPSTPKKYAQYAKALSVLRRHRALWERSHQLIRLVTREKTSSREVQAAFESLVEVPDIIDLAAAHTEGWSGEDILGMECAETKWAIPGIIPEGFTILAGRPKSGKSYLALQLMRSIAGGEPVLGVTPQQGRGLYLGLEDTRPRIKKRMIEQGWDTEAASRVTFFFPDNWPERGELATRKLARILHAGDYRLALIDTMAVFMGGGVKDINDYLPMSALLSHLHDISVETATPISGVHHHNKAASGDPVSDILGSTAIAGIADGIIGLYIDRASKKWSLHITGRDVEEQEIELVRDEAERIWLEAQPRDYIRTGSVQSDVFDAVAALGSPTTAEIMDWLTKKNRPQAQSHVSECLTALVSKTAIQEVPRERGGRKKWCLR
jgi:hypothetical protein